MKKLPQLFLSILLCELTGIISSILTVSAIPTWYATLNKPSFSPPNWLFGPVWTLLYALMGISFFLIWSKGWKKKKVQKAGKIFFIQLALNFFWSLLFFGLRSPLLGLLNIIPLWFFIAFTIQQFYPLSKTAAYLLIPYLLWVSFASILNTALFLLN